jgi:hypothetical protein
MSNLISTQSMSIPPTTAPTTNATTAAWLKLSDCMPLLPPTFDPPAMSQFPYATVTTVTPEYHHRILLAFPVILSLYATQSAYMHPWTYVDTLESRARPHPHTVTHEDT